MKTPSESSIQYQKKNRKRRGKIRRRRKIGRRQRKRKEKQTAMKTQINIFANLLLSEKYCANKARGVVERGWDCHQLKSKEKDTERKKSSNLSAKHLNIFCHACLC